MLQAQGEQLICRHPPPEPGMSRVQGGDLPSGGDLREVSTGMPGWEEGAGGGEPAQACSPSPSLSSQT